MLTGDMHKGWATSAATRGDSRSGSRVKTCRTCIKHACDTRDTIQNGVKLIRIRFRLSGSELPDPDVAGLKKYLSYLLLTGQDREPCKFPLVQCKTGFLRCKRMDLRSRWEFAHSIASISRNLPQGCKVHATPVRSDWESNAFSHPPPSSLEYLSFVRSQVRELFPYGWDRKYSDFVWSHVPNPSARLSAPRADYFWQGREREFRGQCLSGSTDTVVEPVRARYKEVLSAGKLRPLVIYEENSELLAPLHKTIYDHLRGQDWLLVGPPTEKKISSVCVRSYQTSVDLVNATDNLSLDVTEAILGSLLSKSRIPGSVRHYAFRSLRPVVDCDGEGKEVSHGQMMGSYLSFPLLCLHSYVAARWATRDQEAKYLVNGDDTLISSDKPVLASSYPSGYQLNDKKTIRSETVAEINSTAFLRSKGKWREIRHLRRGGFLTDFPGMLHASAAVKGSVAWTDSFIYSRIGKKWGFLPSQLGLNPRSYPAFCRERQMSTRTFSELPGVPSEPDSSLLAVRRPLDPDESIAMVDHLWRFGRSGGRLRDVFRPSLGEVWRSYTFRLIKLRYHLTYQGYLASMKVKRRVEEKCRFVPAEYYSRRDTLDYKTSLSMLDRFQIL